jgi:hypothetical protein
MDKETKELLKRTLTMTDDKLLLKFAKSYAAKDQAFAEAIIEKFLPVENAVDYEKMVKDCFLHRKKGGARRYGSSLDWTVIRKDIKRVLKQLNYLNHQQDGTTAAEGALLLLETLADEFESDCVYEDYNYQNSNYGNEEALDIVCDVLLNDNHVDRDKKLGMVQRLQQLAKHTVYRSYLSCGIDGVINKAQQHLLSPEDLLKEIDKKIQMAKYSSDKAHYVKWKVNVLYELDRNDEAEKVITQYLDLEDISAMRYDQMVADGRYDEAKALCKSKLSKNSDNRSDVQSWHERLFSLGRRTDDKETVLESARWFFAHGNVSQKDKKDYFHLCHESIGEDQWPAYRDKMFQEGKAGNVSIDTVFELYQEEQLFDRMFLYLKKLSDAVPYYSYDPYQNVGGERLVFFSRYAHFLTDAQRTDMVNAFTESIRKFSRYANTRDRYAQVAKALHLLSQSCEMGRQKARLLAAQILRENPNKPAYKEEINSYEY